jgi:type I restriction enzyme, R subunit
MFAVSSVDAAKLYYESLSELQKESDKPLKVATIFLVCRQRRAGCDGRHPG